MQFVYSNSKPRHPEEHQRYKACPERSVRTRVSLLLILLIATLALAPIQAEPSNDDLRDLLLIGNIEAVINIVETDRAFNWKKNKTKINPIASQYYAISLIVGGDIPKAKLFLEAAMKHHPKSQELKDCQKQLDFFENKFINKDLKFNKEEKIHIKLFDLMNLYLQENPKEAAHLKRKILKEINKLGPAIAYFMTKLDYLAELQDTELDKEIETEAFEIIKSKRNVLFPKTLDYYELASAYKHLARLSIKSEDINSTKKYIKLAQNNIYKMKSIWLEEDIRRYRPIMKIEDRSTKFGYILPQWLILLREEYDAYLN